MLRVVLLAATLLLPIGVLGQFPGASEYDELEREFEDLVHDDVGTHRHHRRHHRQFKHHRPFLHHRKRTLLFAAGPATVIPAPPPKHELLPGRHPAVAHKLRHMEQAMRDLRGRQRSSEVARTTLEDSVEKAVLHMNEAVGIKRELARTDASIRAEEIKLKRLEDDRLRLDRTHGHLVSSLQHIMEPKIKFAETRLTQTERALHDLENKADKWKTEEAKYHDSSLSMLESRKETKSRLEAADEAVTKARNEREVAKKQYESAKHNVAFNVEEYRYAQAHARASVSQKEQGEEAVRKAKHSLKRLSSIFSMQQKRVDESMAIGKDRVQGKIRQLEGVEEKSKIKRAKLSEEYGAWQSRQRSWANKVAGKKRVARAASRHYAEGQKEILDAAQEKVAYDAEADSDWAWDEWPTTHKHDTDEVELSAI